ncbi:hypothetical protein ACLK19_07450 [Escherichia coli]
MPPEHIPVPERASSRGSVVMLNGNSWFNRGYRFQLLLRLQRRLARRVSNDFRFGNHNLSSFGNFFNICRLFLGSTTGSACSATSGYGTLDRHHCGCSVTARQLLQDASFQRLPVAVQPERGFYDFSHFFG